MVQSPGQNPFSGEIPETGHVAKLKAQWEKKIIEEAPSKGGPPPKPQGIRNKDPQGIRFQTLSKMGEQIASHQGTSPQRSVTIGPPSEDNPSAMQGRGSPPPLPRRRDSFDSALVKARDAISEGGRVVGGGSSVIAQHGASLKETALDEPVIVDSEAVSVSKQKQEADQEQIDDAESKLQDAKQKLADAKQNFQTELNKYSSDGSEVTLDAAVSSFNDAIRKNDQELERANSKLEKANIFTKRKYKKEKSRLVKQRLDYRAKTAQINELKRQVDLAAGEVRKREKSYAAAITQDSKTTSLNPPEDIHEQELFETPDGKGAMGRVETTSKTDKHQKEGPRNDDNVSMTLLKGGGSIIIETDGAGSGGKNSAVLSHELNRNLNDELTKNAGKLKSLAEEVSKAPPEDKAQAEQKLQDELKRIATGALSKALQALKQSGLPEGLGATTLSLVMSVPISEDKTVTFGLQNHDSVSVLWNPETGDFDPSSYRTEDSKSQISASMTAEANIRDSKFFVSEFTGSRLAIAFSDGVLDNLPGTTDAEKLSVLNDILKNPAFDSPVDTLKHKPTIVLTADAIKSIGDPNVRSSPEEISPKVIRDRIMNFSIWASAGQREKQGGTDEFESLLMSALRGRGPLVNDISVEFKAGQEIDEHLFEALPKDVQQQVTKGEDGKYKFNNDATVRAHAMPKDEYAKLGGTFDRMVPSVTVSKDLAPASVKNRLESDYQKRGIVNGSAEVVYFFDKKVDECIGKNYDESVLQDAQNKDAGAITGKTDGVSVVVANVGH